MKENTMKHIKMLGLLAVAVTTLMAFAGSASATSLTSSEGSTPNIALTAGATSMDGAYTTVTCQKAELVASVTAHGAGVSVSGPVSTLDFTECNFPLTVEANGTLSITSTTSTGNGTLSWSGTKFSIQTSVGTCTFTTSSTDIGTVTGSNNTGGHAKLDITGKIPRTSGNFLCGSSLQWTGSYTFTQPASLEVH